MLHDVRKHRAPKGALRLGVVGDVWEKRKIVRKHRAPKGALRPTAENVYPLTTQRQKAPSANRCIKTLSPAISGSKMLMRQKAPSAKRCIKTPRRSAQHASTRSSVRKHRAPKGALRRRTLSGQTTSLSTSQKAPSAKRCTKTRY